MSQRHLWLTVFSSELLQLVRDRRALFAAIALPALLYPLVFWAQSTIEESSQEILEAREVLAVVDFSRMSEGDAADARAAVATRTPIQILDADASELLDFEDGDALTLDPELTRERRRAAMEGLLGKGGDALLTGTPDPDVQGRTLYRIYYDVKLDDAREAADRVEGALKELERRLTIERRDSLLPEDPAAGLDLELVDVASVVDTTGATLGQMLPLLALLVLLSGGSYAALAVFAGEREAGTLETLLVQPVPSSAVVQGKFAAVLLAGLVTLAANLASILACFQFGIGSLPGMVSTEGEGLGFLRLAGGLVYLPACALLCALLCLVCGRARTFRQGQVTILPVLIVTALPTAIVLQPQVEASVLLSVVPFAGSALALRDALRGELSLLPTLAMIVSHLVWTVLLLSRLGLVLDAERVLSADDDDGTSATRHASSRHGKRWGFTAVLLVYIVGSELQGWNFKVGLLLTLLVLLPLLAVGCAMRARRAPSRLGELRLGLPAPHHLLGAILLVPALVHAVTEWLLPLQMRLLPMPTTMSGAGTEELLTSMSTSTLLLLVAVAPALGEELFFRGALLSSLRRDLKPSHALAWQALFFAAAHASVYRILPTAMLGLLLGAIALRSRSIWPAVILHLGYNGLQVLTQLERLPMPDSAIWVWAPWLAPIGVALLCIRRAPA